MIKHTSNFSPQKHNTLISPIQLENGKKSMGHFKAFFPSATVSFISVVSKSQVNESLFIKNIRHNF